jgi:hypothetical protein
VDIALICRFADGRHRMIDDRLVDLRDAVNAALDLADLHGADDRDGGGTPSCFEVHVDGTSVLSVAVLRGGLLAERPR